MYGSGSFFFLTKLHIFSYVLLLIGFYTLNYTLFVLSLMLASTDNGVQSRVQVSQRQII